MSHFGSSGAVAAAFLVAGSASAAFAQSPLDRLQIHGYLTQAYADASDLPTQGISRTGTADYRVAALLFRYDITTSDQVTVQMRHRRLGTSPLAGIEPDVALNWAFYGHRFQGLGGLTVKAGMLPAPRGIYNETRSVGTVLPFYRASSVLYPEGFETVDGVSVGHTLQLPGSWSLDATGYYGGFNNKAASVAASGTVTTSNARYEQARGGQLWLNTPIAGVRAGIGGVRFSPRPATDTSATVTFSRWYGSVDATFERVFARAEFTQLAAGPHSMGYYVQGGARVVGQLWLNAQHEVSDRTFRGITTHMNRDAAVGISYTPHPALSLKLEQHRARGYTFDRFVSTAGAAGRTNYTIGSIATAF